VLHKAGIVARPPAGLRDYSRLTDEEQSPISQNQKKRCRIEGSTGMTGTTGDIIAIVIVSVVALATWLIMVYYANAHPRWGGQPPAQPVDRHAVGGAVPPQRLSTPGPPVPGQRQGTAADELTPEQARAGETRRE
jgi:hypothetical protein